MTLTPEQIQSIVAIFAAGASIIGTESLKEAGKDLYRKLRSSLSRKAKDSDIQALEDSPDDDLRQEILVRELVKARTDDDNELLILAEQLSTVLQNEHKDASAAFNLNMHNLRAKNVRVKDVDIEGGNAAIDLSDSEIQEDVEFTNIKVKKNG